jgi:hypothetical protein
VQVDQLALLVQYQEQPVPQVKLDLLAQVDHKAQLVLQEQPVLADHKAQLVQVDRLAQPAQYPEQQDPLVPQAQAQQVQLVRQDPQEQLAPQALVISMYFYFQECNHGNNI